MKCFRGSVCMLLVNGSNPFSLSPSMHHIMRGGVFWSFFAPPPFPTACEHFSRLLHLQFLRPRKNLARFKAVICDDVRAGGFPFILNSDLSLAHSLSLSLSLYCRVHEARVVHLSAREWVAAVLVAVVAVFSC